MSAARWHRLAKIILAVGLATTLGHACAQATADELASLRESSQAEMVSGCAVALGEQAIRKALSRAKAEHRDDMTEASIRETVYSSKMRPRIEQMCRCLMTEPLSNVQAATSAAEIQAVVAGMRDGDGASLLAHADELVARCVPKPAEAAPPESARRWELIGHFKDGDRYVDAAAIHAVGAGRVKGWLKAVFNAPKPLGDGEQVLSIRSLKVFDCDGDTEATLGLHAFSDLEQQHAVYDSQIPEGSATFEPSSGDAISQAMRAGVCDRRPH
jgi:hypothetical protein